MNCEKPPIGVKPYYIQAERRIEELASAIYNNPASEKTKEWAYEIILQKKLIEEMKGAK